MLEKNGLGVSQGVVMAKASVFRHSEIYVSHEPSLDREKDAEAFESAYRHTRSQFDAMDSTDESGRSLIAVYKMMLEDPDYLALIRGNIKEKGYNAAWAVEAATEKYISLLEKVDDDFFKERIFDLKDISVRILSALSSEHHPEIVVQSPSILVADYLLASEMLASDLSNVIGLCLDKGGITSHTAILARSLNIPTVFALADFSSCVKDGDIVFLDGNSGTVILNPDKKARSIYKKRIDEEQKKEVTLEEDRNLPCVTTDGREIKLMGNIEGPESIDPLIKAGCDGIGLFRTEFLLMLPEYKNEESRAAVYEETVKRMAPYGPVTFRTYDIGGDKIPESMKIEEENPILGWRAVRLCMERKDIFRDQLISILKASAVHKGVRLMFPMISGSEELRGVLSFFEEVKTECREKGIAFDEDIKIGTMIEVPSAAITADVIANYVDFMSVGTNDLVQYTIAVDRGNDKISYLYRPLHPAVVRLLKHVADSAKKNNIPVSICGEIAGYVDYLPLLVGLGFTELSMSSHSIMNAHRRIRSLSYESCASFANHVLSLPDAGEIEAALKEFNDGKA